jgi:hypothetical protein
VRHALHDIPRSAASPAIPLPEDANLLGFVGSGHVVPNRDALVFIASRVLEDPGLTNVRCRVVGDARGYPRDLVSNAKLEFVGFTKSPDTQLETVGVCCAPMAGAGGVSTKVLTYLMSGKRTVCTPEAAHGIAAPLSGFWVVDRSEFAARVQAALDYPWSEKDSTEMAIWAQAHHSVAALAHQWKQIVSAIQLP